MKLKLISVNTVQDNMHANRISAHHYYPFTKM